MYEYSILTKKTPIVCATKRNSSIAEMPFMPEIYHKEFDVTEFIGESLAGIRNVKSTHYFPLSFAGLRDIEKGKVAFNNDTIRVGSYDFREANKAYLVEPTLTLGMRDKSFERVLDLCSSSENREEFLKENLEMFGLDIYMGQQDRPLNCYYVYDACGEYHLGPLFDYEESLKLLDADDYEYRNDFVAFNDITDYQEMMVKYPMFEEILRSYLDVDLASTIKLMCLTRNFDVNGLDLDSYKRFDEQSHKRLEKILK